MRVFERARVQFFIMMLWSYWKTNLTRARPVTIPVRSCRLSSQFGQIAFSCHHRYCSRTWYPIAVVHSTKTFGQDNTLPSRQPTVVRVRFNASNYLDSLTLLFEANRFFKQISEVVAALERH
jgi:hypothetical protein